VSLENTLNKEHEKGFFSKIRRVILPYTLLGAGLLSGLVGCSSGEQKDWFSQGGQEQPRISSSQTDNSENKYAPLEDLIVYTKQIDKSENSSVICVWDKTGEKELELTQHSKGDFSPCLSPDQKQIAYTAKLFEKGSLNFEICRMNIDGSERKRLTKSEQTKFEPKWSPDGQKIAYSIMSIMSKDIQLDIGIMDADGNNQFNLTNTKGITEGQFDWSPDSKKIVFWQRKFGEDADGETIMSDYDSICVMDARKGAKLKVLASGTGHKTLPAFSPDGKKIAYVHYQITSPTTCLPKIAVMNSDGTQKKIITTRHRICQRPVFSPDGRHIAFESGKGGNWEIYVIKPDGTGEKNISNHPSWDVSPKWTKNGRIIFSSGKGKEPAVYMVDTYASDKNSNLEEITNKILFASNRANPYALDIYITNADGIAPIRVTRAKKAVHNTAPNWTPGNEKIMYTEMVEETAMGRACTDYILNLDGSGRKRITNSYSCLASYSADGKLILCKPLSGCGGVISTPGTPADSGYLTKEETPNNWGDIDSYPSWSPDGKKIIYHSNREDGNPEIYIMNADGSEKTNLTKSTNIDLFPVFSPDGKYIAFHSERDGNAEICIMNADGSNPRRITDNPAKDSWPTWSPDGKWLAFHSNRDGNYEVYKIKTDGTGLTNLTNNPDAQDGCPAWSPR